MITKAQAKELIERCNITDRTPIVSIVDCICKFFLISESFYMEKELKKDLVLIQKILVDKYIDNRNI